MDGKPFVLIVFGDSGDRAPPEHVHGVLTNLHSVRPISRVVLDNRETGVTRYARIWARDNGIPVDAGYRLRFGTYPPDATHALAFAGSRGTGRTRLALERAGVRVYRVNSPSHNPDNQPPRALLVQP